MPILHGVRQRADLHVWDCFDPRQVPSGDGGNAQINLFGNANIGNLALTNILSAGHLSCEDTQIVWNWFARANIPGVQTPYGADIRNRERLQSVWTAWTDSAVVTMILGCMPVRQSPLSELMGPRVFDVPWPLPVEWGDAVIARARTMHSHYLGRIPCPREAMTLEDLPAPERQMWLRAAATSPFDVPVIVPVRQNFSVRVNVDARAHHDLLCVLPENIAPRPLVWVHLGGVSVRDYA